MLSEEMTCGKAQRVGILGKATECQNREEKDLPIRGLGEKISAFMAQEPSLPLQASTISRQPTRGTNDPVAGHDDGDRIRAIGQADGPHALGRSNLDGQALIAECLTCRNGAKAGPNPALKFSAIGLPCQVI